MRSPIGMGRAALVVGASVLLSRLLGLGREVLLAAMFGVSAEGDLYRHAFLIPDLLNYLLAGAYLTITLVPILSRRLATEGPQSASRAFTSVFRFVAWAIVVLTVLMWLLAGPLVALLFPDVAEQGRLVSLTRLVLPAQVFLVLGSLLMAVQYTHRRFLIPAFAPLLYNLGIIGGGLIGAVAGDPSPESFLIGAVIGAAAGNFGLQWLGARRTGTWLTSTRGDSAVSEYLLLALPLMVGQSIAVLDEQFVRFFGQADVGATSALSFARQLNMLPVGLVAQAAGVAAFPFLAHLAARGDGVGLGRTTGRAVRATLFVSVAAAALVVAVSEPMVRVLLTYGRFTEADADLVAHLLRIYAIAIPAWGVHQILSRHFYAQRRMWLPVAIGTAASVLSVPLWLVLRETRGVEGMAAASTIGMTGYAAAMVIAWWRDSGRDAVLPTVQTMVRSALAALVAGAAGAGISGSMMSGEVNAAVSLGALVVGGLTTGAVFLVMSLLIRTPELREMTKRGRPDVSGAPALPPEAPDSD